MDDMTPRNRIKSALRLLWLHSRERAQALKNSGYKCQKCGVKQSKKKGCEQKVEVHHKQGVGNWDKVIDLILDELLCDPKNLEVLCPNCHYKETYGYSPVEECVKDEVARDQKAEEEAIQNMNDCEGRGYE